jgi:hypothetical protein
MTVSASDKKPKRKAPKSAFKPGPDSRRHVHGSKNVEAVQYPIEAVKEMVRLLPPKKWAAIIVEGVIRNRPGYKELYAKYVMGEPAQKHDLNITGAPKLTVEVVMVRTDDSGNGNGNGHK